MSELAASRQISVNSLFNHFFTVPDFQREYIWDEGDVENLLRDIHGAWVKNPESEYFIGAVVLCTMAEEKFYIIDGQQRLTSFFLAFCSLAHHDSIADSGSDSEKVRSGILKKIREGRFTANGVITENRLSVPDADALNCLNCAADGNQMPDSDVSVSAETIKASYETCRSFLDSVISSQKALTSFFYYMTQKVTLLPYVARDINHALLVFETLNSRGKGLTQLDLVKNLLFMHSDPTSWPELRAAWVEFSLHLEASKIKPSSFLKYFLLAQFGEKRMKIRHSSGSEITLKMNHLAWQMIP